MCGLCGFFDLSGAREVDAAAVAAMTRSLIHRGPDSDGYFCEGPLALGFRRLKIIDLQGGEQPMTNEDGSLLLMCNGEIFNYRELRRELQAKGHTFRTNCDVEVLLHLYEEEPAASFLNRLNGQFAFAI